ncbi:uncharacterized protein DS421_12g368600 [Arachis hypogaea]|nr:uncharacterized protein DS421_12g368600 [Arachis hypogaea]
MASYTAAGCDNSSSSSRRPWLAALSPLERVCSTAAARSTMVLRPLLSATASAACSRTAAVTVNNPRFLSFPQLSQKSSPILCVCCLR